jgi:hypothetical protein
MRNHLSTVALGLAAACAAAPALAQTIVSLPPPAGYAGASGQVSVTGGAVGLVTTSGISVTSPARWAIHGGVADPPVRLSMPAGFTLLRGPFASADGGVIASTLHNAAVDTPGYWTTGAFQTLPLPPQAFYGRATGISTDGSVIVGEVASPAGAFGARWVNGQLTTLSTIGTALGAVSPDGQIAMGARTTGGFTPLRLIRWTAGAGGGTLESLADLPAGSAPQSVVAMTPAADAALLLTAPPGSPFIVRSWRWTPSGGVADMGLLAGMDSVAAFSMASAADLAVGYAYDSVQTSLPFRAAIWTAGAGGPGAWQDFAAYLASRGVSFSGWTYWTLSSVSEDGTVFTGSGIAPGGQNAGFVVTIPGPASGAVLALAGAGVARRRRAGLAGLSSVTRTT